MPRWFGQSSFETWVLEWSSALVHIQVRCDVVAIGASDDEVEPCAAWWWARLTQGLTYQNWLLHSIGFLQTNRQSSHTPATRHHPTQHHVSHNRPSRPFQQRRLQQHSHQQRHRAVGHSEWLGSEIDFQHFQAKMSNLPNSCLSYDGNAREWRLSHVRHFEHVHEVLVHWLARFTLAVVYDASCSQSWTDPTDIIDSAWRCYLAQHQSISCWIL